MAQRGNVACGKTITGPPGVQESNRIVAVKPGPTTGRPFAAYGTLKGIRKQFHDERVAGENGAGWELFEIVQNDRERRDVRG